MPQPRLFLFGHAALFIGLLRLQGFLLRDAVVALAHEKHHHEQAQHHHDGAEQEDVVAQRLHVVRTEQLGDDRAGYRAQHDAHAAHDVDDRVALAPQLRRREIRHHRHHRRAPGGHDEVEQDDVHHQDAERPDARDQDEQQRADRQADHDERGALAETGVRAVGDPAEQRLADQPENIVEHHDRADGGAGPGQAAQGVVVREDQRHIGVVDDPRHLHRHKAEADQRGLAVVELFLFPPGGGVVFIHGSRSFFILYIIMRNYLF